jgi:6-phosphogluconate dehydrogenase (decarboxylating)
MYPCGSAGAIENSISRPENGGNGHGEVDRIHEAWHARRYVRAFLDELGTVSFTEDERLCRVRRLVGNSARSEYVHSANKTSETVYTPILSESVGDRLAQHDCPAE